jgi:hypothetical protein
MLAYGRVHLFDCTGGAVWGMQQTEQTSRTAAQRPHAQGAIGFNDEIKLATSPETKLVTDCLRQRELTFAGDGGKHMDSLLFT